IGNPACANMLMALLSGPALTATELAQEAGLSLSTVSGHLDKLQKACLVAVERQGRHRYFRLADPDVAAALEGLMPVATRAGHLVRRASIMLWRAVGLSAMPRAASFASPPPANRKWRPGFRASYFTYGGAV